MKRPILRLAAFLLFAAVPALPAQAPKSFAGHWTGNIKLPAQELAFDVDLTISLQGSALIAVVGNQPPYQLVPKRGTEFTLKGLTGFSVAFTMTADGTVSGAQLRQPNGVFTANRVQ